MQFTLAHGLRDILLSILDDSQSEEQVNHLVKVCHALAHAFVASKAFGGVDAQGRLGLSTSDLTYDVIADLFRRDDRGSLLHVKTYFAAIDLSGTSDLQLLIHLRRLVFSTVNQGLYRFYRQADPTFGKILRNIKLAVVTLQNFTEFERFGEPCLAPALTDPLLGRPPLELSYLETALSPLVRGTEPVPVLLGTLSLVLREQNDYCRIVPLTRVASLFRSMYCRGRIDEGELADPHAGLLQGEIRQVAARASRRAVDRYMPAYSREHGWGEDIAQAYTKVVEENLLRRLLDSDRDGFTYFTALRECLPDLSVQEYRSLHKNKLEYVGRLAYEIFVAEFKDGF